MAGDATWVFIFRKLAADTYSVESAGEVSLVNRTALEELLRPTPRGGTRGLGMGGGYVG